MSEIKLGTKVRSFDFADGDYGRDVEGEGACYVEGTVVGFAEMDGCERYAIFVEKRVWEGKADPEPLVHGKNHVYPPKNGTPTWTGRVTNYVEAIG